MPRGRKKQTDITIEKALYDAKNREVTLSTSPDGFTVAKPSVGYSELFKKESDAQSAFEFQINCTQN